MLVPAYKALKEKNMEKIKNSRVKSFIFMALIYLVAIIGGILVYEVLPFNSYVSLLIADIVATAITYLYSVIFENASVYDPYWSVAPIVIAIYLALSYGFSTITALIFIAVLFWGIRLTANWAYTFKGLTHQDWRYTMLKEKTGKAYQLVNFVGIHLVPTLVVYSCIVPVVYAFENELSVNFGSVYFFLMAIVAVIIQGTADIQMHKYRKTRKTPFIRTGLWKHARHPNYLGEILMWWSIALMVVCASPSAWYLIIGAVANTLLFAFVSIPMAEGKQAKKEGYAEYKRETRALLPIKKFTK